MKIRRIVFGEPKPGEATFATLLGRLDESVSYCNRTGPLEHDRVTDVPFTVPLLGLNFAHPTNLSFVSALPASDDQWGIFALHHIELYEQGAQAAKLDPVHLECVHLCRAIYDYPGNPTQLWDERLTTAGVSWGIKSDNGRAFVVFRGSDDLMDWLRDLTGFDPAVTRTPAFGPMWDGFAEGMAETWMAIKPLISGASELVITGHSLGAARADVTAGYALAG